MKRSLIIVLCLIAIVLLTACTPQLPVSTQTPSQESPPAGVPARPGSGVTGDPSANLPELVEVSGTVKEVKEGLVLITQKEGGDFMLRFSENSKWDNGVSKDIKICNSIKCLVKLEPTFAPPSQGEVFEVIQNDLS